MANAGNKFRSFFLKRSGSRDFCSSSAFPKCGESWAPLPRLGFLQPLSKQGLVCKEEVMPSVRSACWSWRKQTRFWAVCLSKAAALRLNLSWSNKRYYLSLTTSHSSYPQILVFLFKMEQEVVFLPAVPHFSIFFPARGVAVTLLRCRGPGLLLLDVTRRALVSSVCWEIRISPCPLCQRGLVLPRRRCSLELAKNNQAKLKQECFFHRCRPGCEIHWKSCRDADLPGVLLAEMQELVPRTLDGFCFLSNRETHRPSSHNNR